jgi:hypothetical protein
MIATKTVLIRVFARDSRDPVSVAFDSGTTARQAGVVTVVERSLMPQLMDEILRKVRELNDSERRKLNSNTEFHNEFFGAVAADACGPGRTGTKYSGKVCARSNIKPVRLYSSKIQ